MEKTAPPFEKSGGRISVADLQSHAHGWLLDGRIRQWSARTLASRKDLLEKLVWFLKQQECEAVGKPEVRAFLAYVSTGHENAGGRWGNAACRAAVQPVTVVSYYNILRAFFAFLVADEVIAASPLHGLRPPLSRQDQVAPFTPAQVQALLTEARRSTHPRRDEAILLLLIDSGLRASELCSLRRGDLDFQGYRCVVQGKGKKQRMVPFGRTTAKALWQYLREDAREPSEPLFTGDRGIRAGEPMTRSGLGQLVRKLGRKTGIEATRCSPHTCRHYFAVEFLRAGGNLFTLKELLGHTTLAMVNRYVSLAQADLEAQHRQFSPADRLKKR
jgi:site-specific recombinase XerD